MAGGRERGSDEERVEKVAAVCHRVVAVRIRVIATGQQAGTSSSTVRTTPFARQRIPERRPFAVAWVAG